MITSLMNKLAACLLSKSNTKKFIFEHACAHLIFFPKKSFFFAKNKTPSKSETTLFKGKIEIQFGINKHISLFFFFVHTNILLESKKKQKH
jgi:hypothetical protein